MGDTTGLDVDKKEEKVCPRCNTVYITKHTCPHRLPRKPLEMSIKAYESRIIRLDNTFYTIPLYVFNAVKRIIDTYEDGQLIEKQSHWESKTEMRGDEEGIHIEDKTEYTGDEPVDRSWEATGQGSKWSKSKDDE